MPSAYDPMTRLTNRGVIASNSFQMNASSTRHHTNAIMACMLLVVPDLVAQYEPTAHEQYILELTNRARANPQAEVNRLAGKVWGDTGAPASPNLNEGLAPGTIPSTAKKPLAFNTGLIKAARDYCGLCLVTNQWGHNVGGTDPGQRMSAAGYSFAGSWMWGENIAWSGDTAPFQITTAVEDDLYEMLFIDGDIAGRGHRLNIMDPDFKEIGVGLGAGSNYNGGEGGIGYNAAFTTMDFAYTAEILFLLVWFSRMLMATASTHRVKDWGG